MTASAKITTLEPVDVHHHLAAHRIVLIDVREPAEYAAERIQGALLFPMSTFDPGALPDVGPRPIVFHCGSGKRSAMAVERCQRAGVAIDRHMTGGIGAWKAVGLPVVGLDPDIGGVREAR
jgi:rhodanese-related sulfurtransferase